MPTEADTCRTYILPKLKSAGWEDDYIAEQLVLTPGQIVADLDGFRAKVNALRELQSTGGEALSALMPSVLDRAFKGEL